MDSSDRSRAQRKNGTERFYTREMQVDAMQTETEPDTELKRRDKGSFYGEGADFFRESRSEPTALARRFLALDPNDVNLFAFAVLVLESHDAIVRQGPHAGDVVRALVDAFLLSRSRRVERFKLPPSVLLQKESDEMLKMTIKPGSERENNVQIDRAERA